MIGIKQKTISGLTWSSIEQFSVQGLKFIITIVIARMLQPSDYGLVGMMSIFIAISISLIDSGFSAALIQKKDRTQSDLSTIFFFNLGMSTILYCIIIIFTPHIANFYGEPKLILLSKVISINIIIQSLSIIQITHYSINLNFKTQAKASLLSALVSGIIGIVLAYKGFGVWALVWPTIVNNLLNVVLLWLHSKWIPNLTFSKKSILSLFPFGSKLLIAGFLYTVFENIYLVIIGRFFSSKDLGYYVKAKNFSNLPSSILTSIVLRVTFPVLSSIQDDEPRLISTYKKIVRFTLFITFPLIILLAVLSKPLILFFLTEKWYSAASFLQLLCFVMIWFPLNEVNINLLKVKGKSDSILILSIIRIVITVLVLLITIPYGLTVLIIGQIVSAFLIFLIIYLYTCNFFKINPRSQLFDIAHFLLVLLVIGFIVNFINKIEMSNFTKLISESILFLGLYLGYSKYVFKHEINEILSIIRNRN
jgi:teichuronic acid exporter